MIAYSLKTYNHSRKFWPFLGHFRSQMRLKRGIIVDNDLVISNMINFRVDSPIFICSIENPINWCLTYKKNSTTVREGDSWLEMRVLQFTPNTQTFIYLSFGDSRCSPLSGTSVLHDDNHFHHHCLSFS